VSQRVLLAAGLAMLAASFLLGAVGTATGGLAPWAVTGPGGMMGGWDGVQPGTSGVSMGQAQTQVQTYLDRIGNNDLKIDELLEFDQNFYALIKEKSTGRGAFELLVDKANGAVTPEPGPNMMWNAKYGGMAGGMMGAGRPSGAMSVSADRATQSAQTWLDQRAAGYSAGTPDTFYGYYTFDFTKDGVISGMLSVNGQSGAVWFHSWHGNFISSKQVG
jgi:hypothetical protein